MVVRDGATTVIATRPAEVVVADGDRAFAALDRIETGGWWAGFCGYDLGRAVEPIEDRTDDDRGIPDLAMARFDARLRLYPDGTSEIVGNGDGRVELERARWRASGRRTTVAQRLRADRWTSSLTFDRYRAAERAIHGHLDAGDCYQVNLTRRLTHDRAVDPVELFVALDHHNPAPHACLLRFGTRGPALAVVGASPELFLRIDHDDLTTRPIKGTHRDAEPLRTSAKDRAEHVMIVDLARNDLGRVCIAGTVAVTELMALESHPGLHHLVSTVTGRRRAGVTLGAVMRAMFPAASITGAPKPSVMQIIEDLEPVRRGVYCGATGWVDHDTSRAEFAVAIRTFTVTARHTDLGVGGGIVADSSAESEWDETELKARRLLETARGSASGDRDERNPSTGSSAHDSASTSGRQHRAGRAGPT